MTGKERAGWRAKANSLEALFQIGKGGINDALIKQTEDALNARELIKIKVLLESTPISPKDAASELSEKTHSDVIQVIGGVIVLYRENPELRKKEAEKQKAKKAAARKAKDEAYKKAFLEKKKYNFSKK